MPPQHPGTLLANNTGNAIGSGSDVIPSSNTTSGEPQHSGQAASSVVESDTLAAITSSSALTNGGSPVPTIATSGSKYPQSGSTGSGLNGAAMSTTTSATMTTTTNNNNNNNSGGATSVKSCAGCGARIVDRFLLHAMDRYWHTGCLKCSCCQAQLGEIGTSCFTKAGMILCKNDYIRLFGSSGTCAACSQSIPAQEFVMRAQSNVYHVNCFTCVTCHQRLVPGDRYSIVNGSLICEQDYPKVLKGHTTIPMRSTHKVC